MHIFAGAFRTYNLFVFINNLTLLNKLAFKATQSNSIPCLNKQNSLVLAIGFSVTCAWNGVEESVNCTGVELLNLHENMSVTNDSPMKSWRSLKSQQSLSVATYCRSASLLTGLTLSHNKDVSRASVQHSALYKSSGLDPDSRILFVLKQTLFAANWQISIIILRKIRLNSPCKSNAFCLPGYEVSVSYINSTACKIFSFATRQYLLSLQLNNMLKSRWFQILT